MTTSAVTFPARMKKDRDNVIHVDFRGRSSRPPALDLAASAEVPVVPRDATPEVDPAVSAYSAREVSKLFGVSPSRLRVLAKKSIVSPSAERGGKPAYTFQDLVALRATILLSSEVKLRDVAKAIEALKERLPRVTRPLHELRIVSDGKRIVVRGNDGAFEPLTGQLVLDFDVQKLEEEVVRVLRPKDDRARRQRAHELYFRANELDESPATWDDASKLYRQALELDPYLSIAYTNLGNIHFRKGERDKAIEFYRKAVEVDPGQPEAQYNLGYVSLEDGDHDAAIRHFERALDRDPDFADAHFNLAMAYEQTRDKRRAVRHWKRYLELEPTGAWAEIARKHVGA